MDDKTICDYLGNENNPTVKKCITSINFMYWVPVVEYLLLFSNKTDRWGFQITKTWKFDHASWQTTSTLGIISKVRTLGIPPQYTITSTALIVSLHSTEYLQYYDDIDFVSCQIVFQCMVFSLKKVINIIIITLLCLFMFAVIGVHLFQVRTILNCSLLNKEE